MYAAEVLQCAVHGTTTQNQLDAATNDREKPGALVHASANMVVKTEDLRESDDLQGLTSNPAPFPETGTEGLRERDNPIGDSTDGPCMANVFT